MKKEKIKKKNYDKLNNIIVFVLILSVLYLTFCTITTVPEIRMLNKNYESLMLLNEEYKLENKKLINYTDAEKKEMAEIKARSEGYVYPQEIIYYDIR